MNFIFWLLVIFALIVLWFIISFVFIPLGSIILKKWNKTLEILNKDKNDNEEKETKNE